MPVLDGFKKMLARMIGEDVGLKIALAAEPLTVRADTAQIEQVLMNLAANARDAMPQGGSLAIEASPFLMDRAFIQAQGFGEPGRYALLTLSDTGRGMKEETKEVGKGTGLGLSIVYGVVKQHKGYIVCSSIYGRGTTFRIYLPLVSSAAEQRDTEEFAAAAGGTETVLLAEDDSAVRGLIKQML